MFGKDVTNYISFSKLSFHFLFAILATIYYVKCARITYVIANSYKIWRDR